MGQQAFFGLDVGTSSTKAVLVRPDGSVLGTRTREHAVERGPGGAVGMDPGIWWEEFRELYAALAAEHGAEVLGIGVSGMGPCAAVADLDDAPIAPAALYGIDHRAREEVARLSEELGEERLLAERDSLLTSQAAGPKLAWFAARHPERFDAGVRLYMPSSWIVRRLTGEYVLDRHSASQCTPLYDAARQEWDPEMAQRIAPGVRLPRLGWSTEVCGTTRERPDLPELRAGIPVIFGSIDAWAEQESVGATGADELFLMYGTTLFLIANSPRRVRHPSMWGTTGTRPGTHNLAGGLATSGALTDWFRSLSGVEDYAELTDDAARVGPGAGGLLALPYFAGERTPLQDPDARGVVAGLTLEHGRGHLYRALLEATAFAVRHNVEVMEDAGASVGTLVCAGGGVRSDLWPRIVSDVTGLRQVVRRNTVGASYGDAFMVAEALGAVERLDDWNPVERVIEPEPLPLYDDLYQDYRRLYEATAEIQHRLSAVQHRKGENA
ncbi:FGGY family carbohydrate kinase [Rothia sp. AR01]|uniref:FGGY family carbohydrate kinase n=1 Tax=Rothia santali TaxID=2949643 RepID=A0A9X2HJJ5_9MICC|nr:FGGY family carbohydrate kinase [Rothia santali]MCP3425428.1 FGGY family carbohydrate kinase [Rothia santali]